MQSLDSGELFSILDLPKGYFYKQHITHYRIYKSDGKFYACLESSHNRLAELSEADRQKVLSDILKVSKDRHIAQMLAFHSGAHNRTAESRHQSNIALKKKNAQIKRARVEAFLAEHYINKEQYIQNYLKYKDHCPNRHLELLYNISYSKVRDLNKYFNLFGGGSRHKGGKVIIEENN